MIRTRITQKLSLLYGFPFPAAFAPLVGLAIDAASSRSYFDEGRFLSYYGFRMDFPMYFLRLIPRSPRNDRFGSIGRRPTLKRLYQHTPPEFFEFGWLGADGVSYGYLVHVPGMCEDYPICENQPMVSKGLNLLGENTAQGLEGLFSQELAWWQQHPPSPESRPLYQAIIDQVAAVYGIAPSAEKRPHPAARYTPNVPDGWRFEPSSDGVGALAPAQYFAPYPLVIAKWGDSTKPALTAARKALDEGYPATALLTVRGTYYEQWSARDLKSQRRLCALWIEAYEALNRPLLAAVVKRLRGDHL